MGNGGPFHFTGTGFEMLKQKIRFLVIGDELVSARNQSRSIACACILGAFPVSYTHLDVYKRQTFPNILVNPSQGIAVGMASNIASFNLREVCAATIAYLDDPNCDVMKYMTAPDFSTGASIIYDQGEMRRIYETGRGSFKMRSSYRFDKKNSLVEIYEIPYTTSIEAIMEKIIELIKAGKLRDVYKRQCPIRSWPPSIRR